MKEPPKYNLEKKIFSNARESRANGLKWLALVGMLVIIIIMLSFYISFNKGLKTCEPICKMKAVEICSKYVQTCTRLPSGEKVCGNMTIINFSNLTI